MLYNIDMTIEDLLELTKKRDEMKANFHSGELYASVPHECFRQYNTELHKMIYAGKPIYVYENHSSSLQAWREVAQKSSIRVLTFDEHSDTHPPLWGYCCRALKHDEDSLVRLIDALKNNLNDNIVEGLYKPIPKYTNQYLEGRLLQNTEHIAAAIYWGIASEVCICCSEPCQPEALVANESLKNIYKKVSFIKAQLSSVDFPSIFYKCGYFNSLLELHKKSLANFDDDTIGRITKEFNLDEDFILDIDLDFFQTPFILDREYGSLQEFSKLIKKAKAITIATECAWVDRQVESYISLYEEIDKNCTLFTCANPFRKEWDSRDLLKYILGLIEYVLSGQMESELAIENQITKEWDKIMEKTDSL